MSATLSLREITEKLGAKRGELAQLLASKKVDGEYKMTSADVDDVRQRREEIDDLASKQRQMQDIEGIGKEYEGEAAKSRPIVPEGEQKGAPQNREHQRQVRSIGEILDASDGYKAFRAGRVKGFTVELGDLETKTLLTLSDITPVADRRAGVVPMALPYRSVSDLMLDGSTDGNTLEYYEETTFTNNAAEVAEGASKPESALDFTLRTDAVRKIATWIPATDEVLADNAQLRSYIEERLRFMVIKRREQQLISGDGTAPNISGILDRSGIQTQAKGADPTFDAIMKAMTLVRYTADAEPTGLVMHPNDWQDLVLTRTADGVYILGNPGETMASMRLWGLDVRVVPAMTENTALVGAFRPYAQIFRRGGLTVTASTEHSTYFIENKVAILAEERLGLAVYRPAAFATVTGI
jgi:HK97 family phage major capsid protein